MNKNTEALELINDNDFAIHIEDRFGDCSKEIETIRKALEAQSVEFAFNVLIQDMEAAIDTIGYLLPLAKGYVAAHPGIRSTEAIIEDAEAMIRGGRDE